MDLIFKIFRERRNFVCVCVCAFCLLQNRKKWELIFGKNPQNMDRPLPIFGISNP